jgi:hypothetical protein
MRCAGCDNEVPPNKGPGRRRKWCSERCRKITLYSRRCLDCGAVCNTGGRVAEPAVRCLVCHNAYERTVERRQARKYATEKKWTDAEMLAALRAHAVNGVISSKAYERARKQASEPMPSMPLIALRFGSWMDAAAAAGLRSCRSKRRSDTLYEAGAWLAVEECTAELGHLPTTREYEEWAQRVGAPCLSTVRRLTGGWRGVMAREAA